MQTLLDEWGAAIENMIESFIDLWDHPQALMQMIGAPFVSAARQLLGSAMEPWVATRLSAKDPWDLGMPWDVPSDWALVTPGLFKGGKPGDPNGRTPSLWIEEALPHNLKRGPRDGRANLGPLLFPGWPYGTVPKQHRCARHNACTADLAATLDPEVLRHPAAYLDPAGPPPAGTAKFRGLRRRWTLPSTRLRSRRSSSPHWSVSGYSKNRT
ncbi:hypothetical protein [Nannocystis pusilla]|uniref:hypothetical protein n=1 Tax=Nannocystis pusilla TaxID=889268 RepID=UPI003B7A7432